MGTKAGELRETLMEAIAAVRRGELKAAEAKAIAALAGQANLSLQVELNLRTAEVNLKDMGSLPLGEQDKREWPFPPALVEDKAA